MAGDLSAERLVSLNLWFAKRLALRVEAFGFWTGLRYTVLDSRARSTVRLLRPPGERVEVAVRFGRRQSDMQTLLHVFGARCYELGLDDPRIIIDAGANAGYSALWFALRYPRARVVAIEPDDDNVELLHRNTHTVPNVEIVHGALMDVDGRCAVVDPGLGPWGIRVQSPERRWTDGRVIGSVDCISMESLVDRLGVDRIDLLKLDIEGGEVDVLGRSEPWIGQVDAVIAELHDHFRPGCTQAFFSATQGYPFHSTRDECLIARRSCPESPSDLG